MRAIIDVWLREFEFCLLKWTKLANRIAAERYGGKPVETFLINRKMAWEVMKR